MSETWCLIESDPGIIKFEINIIYVGVFTEMISSLGVHGLQVEEIYSLEDRSLYEDVEPIHGLIFLFRFDSELYQKDQRPTIPSSSIPNVFYSKQIVNNACATQAILHILLNLPANIPIGGMLSNFKELVMPMDSTSRGEQIGQNNGIRNIHNSFCASDPLLLLDRDTDDDNEKDGNAYHFISYIPIEGKIYELDGLRGDPIVVGEYNNNSSWIEVVKSEVKRRMEEFSSKENGFTLLGVVDNIKEKCMKELNKENELIGIIQNYGISNTIPAGYSIKDIGETEEDRSLLIASHQEMMRELEEKVLNEDKKFERYRIENTRRKHNYIPFAMELLKILVEKNLIDGIYNEAEQKV